MIAPLILGSPGNLLPQPVALVMAIGTGLSIVWISAEVMRRQSVRGSGPRYIFASVERTCRYPVLFYFVISAFLELRWYHDALLTVTSCAGIALWFVLWQEKRKGGDDDDFWTSLRKRLGSMFPSPATATGSA